MTKKSLFFILILLNFTQLFAQWTTVGVPFFSNSGISGPFISLDQSGTPYMVFRSYSIQRICVMKFDGSNWVYVGTPGFSAGIVDGPTMAFDNTGTPYVAYTDKTDYSRATVMKFDGSNWVYVGAPGFTLGAATFTSIAIDKNNIPYVTFRDQGDTVYNSWPNGYRASVMKYDGNDWVYVGKPGFSLDNGARGALSTSLAIDANGTLYVAYTDFSNDFKATVMKFDGSNWVYVGASGFSPWQTATTSIVLDSNGMPYVAYSDRANDSKATVMKFDGNNWIQVGSPGFTSGAADNTFISLDANDIPFVAYKDYANGQRASVMKFDGKNWMQVGTPGFSTAPPSEVYKTTLAIDKNKGILYVAYDDIQYDSTWMTAKQGATVMKYDITTSIKKIENNYTFSIFPNPTGTSIAVDISSVNPKAVYSLKVTNVLSQTVYSETIKDIPGSFNKQLDLSSLPKGTYFVELSSGSNQESRKVQKLVLQ